MRIFHKGRQYIQKETNLVYLIKKLRPKTKNFENGIKIIDIDVSEISDDTANEGKLKAKEKTIWNGKVFKKDRGDLIPSLKVKKKLSIIDKSFQSKKKSDPFPSYNFNNRSRNLNFSMPVSGNNSIGPL